ncbi:MAG: hypothetical protein XU15_C0011G0111 [candidate division NC10 bacterium CSP1-5]|nr:MAG: hypothetical protein XU15_C0011G0111 [candidate division NC10 bacterium CSP1-5]
MLHNPLFWFCVAALLVAIHELIVRNRNPFYELDLREYYEPSSQEGDECPICGVMGGHDAEICTGDEYAGVCREDFYVQFGNTPEVRELYHIWVSEANVEFRWMVMDMCGMYGASETLGRLREAINEERPLDLPSSKEMHRRILRACPDPDLARGMGEETLYRVR